MRVIVSGAGGFLGRNLVKELCARRHQVTALIRKEQDRERLADTGAQTVVCPMCSYRKWKADEAADVFFHLAWSGTSGSARGDADRQMENVRGTIDAVALAEACGCRKFLFAGSIMEYEAVHTVPAEGARPGRGFIYSTGKLAADYMAKILAQDAGMDYVCLMISNIYGPDEVSDRFLNTLVRNMGRDEPIRLTHGQQMYDFIYITDAVRAMAQIAEQGCAQNYYIGHAKQRPLREYIEIVREAVHADARLIYGAVPYTGPMQLDPCIDTKKLEREFGFQPQVDFKSGIGLLLQYKKAGE